MKKLICLTALAGCFTPSVTPKVVTVEPGNEDTPVPDDSGILDSGGTETGSTDSGTADSGTDDSGTDDTAVVDPGDTGTAPTEPLEFTPMAVWTGDDMGSRLGASIAAGDLTGDGRDEIIVGAPEGSFGAGYALILSPPSAGAWTPDVIAQTVQLDDMGIVRLGTSVTLLGDLWSDGTIDAAATAPDSDAVMVVHGLNTGSWTLTQNPIASRYGEAVVSGDFNGDSLIDIAIGAPASSSNKGAVYVQTNKAVGPTSMTVFEGALGDAIGTALAGGDFNGDGIDDLMIGAQFRDSNRGAAFLVLGPVTAGIGNLEPDLTLSGVDTEDRMGTALGVGDIEGDGYAEIAISAPRVDRDFANGGAIMLVNLGGTVATIVGEATADEAGKALDLGDVDGDGDDDIVIGAWEHDVVSSVTSEGRAYLVQSPVGGTITLDHAYGNFTGVTAYENVGTGVAFAQITDDVGLEVLLGAPGWQSGDNRGAIIAIDPS